MAEPEQIRGASVTSRALSVLGAFEGSSGSLTVARIAARAQLPLSTTYRMVHELEQWGGLRKGSDGKYQVGFRIWELGQLAGRRLRDRAHPFLQDLFDLTHENVHLAIREGTQSLYVDKIYSSRKMPQVSRIGGRLTLHATAVGRVLLAAQPDWFVDAYLQRELEAPTPKTVTDPRMLTQLIDDVRRDGRGERGRRGLRVEGGERARRNNFARHKTRLNRPHHPQHTEVLAILSYGGL